MSIVKKIFDFYIFSNLHVALAGFCITKISLLKFGFDSNLSPVLVSLGIIVSYNFIRFFEIKSNRIIWLKDWLLKNKIGLIVINSFSLIAILVLFLDSEFNFKALIVLFPFVLMTIFYVIPLFKTTKMEFSFRNFPGIKIFCIALAWAGITVLFPLVEIGFSLNNSVIIEFAQRFLFIIVITLPFDIRDIYFDSKSLKTIPQVFGIFYSKIFGVLLMIIFFILELTKENLNSQDIFIASIITVVCMTFLFFSTPTKSRYYTSFWVELIPVFWFLLVLGL